MITLPRVYVICNLYSEEIAGTFMKMRYKKQMKKRLRIEKVFRKNGDKLYVKHKDFDNYFNSWID